MKEKIMFRKNFFGKFARLIAEHEDSLADTFFEKIFELIAEIRNYDYISIYLYYEKEHKINLVAKKGAEIDLIKLIKFELGNGLSAWVAKDRKIVNLKIINNKTADGKIIRSFCSFPLLQENKLVGVMNLGSQHPNNFDDDVINTLEIFSPLLASIIAKNNLISKITKQKNELEQLNKEIKETKDQLIKLEQKEAVAAAIVSLNHEINNPLMIIQGNLQLLKCASNDFECQTKIKTIENQLDRVSILMKKLQNLKEVKLKEYIEGSEHKMLDIG